MSIKHFSFFLLYQETIVNLLMFTFDKRIIPSLDSFIDGYSLLVIQQNKNSTGFHSLDFVIH